MDGHECVCGSYWPIQARWCNVLQILRIEDLGQLSGRLSGYWTRVAVIGSSYGMSGVGLLKRVNVIHYCVLGLGLI